MPCSICAHPEAAAIAAAVARGDSYRTIEGAYGVNKSSLSRHRRICLAAVSAAPQAVTTVPIGQPHAPAHATTPLAAYHAEARRLQQAAARVMDIYGVQRLLVSLCELLQGLPAAPTAPAQVVNPQVHQAAIQLYTVLVNRTTTVDTRQAVAEVVRLLLQVVRDGEGHGDDRTTGR